MKQLLGNKLFDSLVGGQWDPSSDGRRLNDLLDGFQKGFSIENLLILTNSERDGLVRAGAWIASELGSGARVVFSQIKGLLRSSDPKVRFYMTDCVIVCADADDGESILGVAKLLEDSEGFVRWKALDSLCKFRCEQICAGLAFALHSNAPPSFLEGFNLVSRNCKRQICMSELEGIIQCRDVVLKKFAISAAIRGSYDNGQLRGLVALSGSEEIEDYCSDL